MKITIPIFMMAALALMLIGHTLYDSGEIENIYNLTEETLVWEFNYTEIVIENISDATSVNIVRAGRVSNVIVKFADFMGYSAMEISKYFIEFGYNNPQYDYEYGFMIIKFYFILMLVSVCVPLIVPALLLIYLVFIGIKKLINKVYRNKGKGGNDK